MIRNASDHEIEDLVQLTCALYRRRGWACIERLDPPVRKGRRPGFYQAEVPVHFLGAYSGQPVAVLVFRLEEQSFGLGRIAPRQRSFLEDHSRAGGVGIIIVQFPGGGGIFATTLEWVDSTSAFLNEPSISLRHFRECAGAAVGVGQITPFTFGIPAHFGRFITEQVAYGAESGKEKS